MTSTQSLSGVYSAQWLPIGRDGSIDRSALSRHLQFERENGVTGILALGSTGEFPFFSVAERKGVIETVAELADGLDLLVNISDIRPGSAIELGQVAAAVEATAVALMPPMFFPVATPDLLAYFLHIAEKVALPVMLYNFPELTGKRIPLEMIAAFADRAPMIAIKQSGAEFDYHRELVAMGRAKGFVVMSGADTRLPEAFALGATGCIGGLVNIVPELMVSIWHACREGFPERVAEAATRMRTVGRVIDQLTFPPNVAAGLLARGFSPGVPKSILSRESQELSWRITAELRGLFAEWGLKLVDRA